MSFITWSKVIISNHSPLKTVQVRAGIEDLVGLRLKAARIFHHLPMRELRPRLRAPGGIADHRGEIADDQDRLVPEILELAQLGERDGKAEMDIRRGGIDPELHIERTAQPQLRQQLRLADDLSGALRGGFRVALRAFASP